MKKNFRKNFRIALLGAIFMIGTYRFLFCDVFIYYDFWGIYNYSYKSALPYKFPACIVNPMRAPVLHRAINEHMRVNYEWHAYHTHVKLLPTDVFEKDAYTIHSIKYDRQGKHVLILFDNSNLDLAIIMDTSDQVIDIY